MSEQPSIEKALKLLREISHELRSIKRKADSDERLADVERMLVRVTDK